MQALLLNRGEPYRVSHPVDGGDECTVLEFPTHAVLQVLDMGDERAATPFPISHAPTTPASSLHFRRLRRALRGEQAPCALAVEEEALNLLAWVARDGGWARRPAARRSTLRQRRTLVEEARRILASAPGAPHSLSGIAREVHSSPFHLTRVFRDEVGMPMHRFLLRLRLTVALDRLDEGERDLSALALELGFSSHSHFSTAFRRLFGMTPSRFAAR